ncbi:MAG: IS66 family transposase [Leptospiraceae bacterium]|nr:IS66 family transposase [Leptospiraceae bacterium]
MPLPENLPTDSESLKQYIHSLVNQYNALEELKDKLLKENQLKQEKILKLEIMLFDFKRNRFGSKSEKLDPKDLYASLLFNEPEVGLRDEEKIFEGHSETIHVKSFSRKKRGRKPLPENLRRVDIIHDIPESEKNCNCGCRLEKIGEEISENLGHKPAEIYVERHIQYKYACKGCEGDERDEAGKIVVTAEKPPQLLPKSLLTPELFVYIIVSKYLDHIPFYRMEQIFLRYGLEITRATLCNWTIGVYEKYLPLFSFYKSLLLSGRLLGIDETVLQVHREEGRSDTTNSYMFLIRGGTVEQPILLYMYRETRSVEFLKRYLNGYNGIIQTDGFNSYDAHFKGNENILHASCMAHVRRGFEKLWKANKNPIAYDILNRIKELYKVEEEIRALKSKRSVEFSEIVSIRQEKSKPIFDSLHIHLQNLLTTNASTLGLGDAIRYALGQWNKLAIYLSHGEVYIDNNLVENAIRPFVLGRKNWLFSDSPDGASASAFWYSLLQTAKANAIDPYKFLLQFLNGLPHCQTPQDCEKLFKDSMGWG